MEILGLDMIKKEPETINITGLDKIRQVFHNDLPRMSPFALEFTRLVGRLRELDREFEEFGAEYHQYTFNAVVPLSKVRDFEERHKIKLPHGYVEFLTQVGNGGAGVAYGFYSIEELENKYKRTNMLVIADYGCGKFGILNENGTVGYIDIDDTEKSLSHEMSFEEFALKWAKDTIKKYEN